MVLYPYFEINSLYWIIVVMSLHIVDKTVSGRCLCPICPGGIYVPRGICRGGIYVPRGICRGGIYVPRGICPGGIYVPRGIGPGGIYVPRGIGPGGIKIRSPFHAVTDWIYCPEAPGSPWPLQGIKSSQ